MAGKNRYLFLKFYAKKLGKFKQDVLLPAANAKLTDEAGRLGDNDYEVVRTGACLTITMLWLRQIVTGKTYFKYADIPNDQNTDLITLAAQAGRGHANLKQNSASTAHEKRLYLAKHLGVPIGEDGFIGGITFSNAVRAFGVLPVGRGGLVSSVAYRKSSDECIGRHATGFYANKTSFVRFFDPNVGEYEININDLDSFFKEYIEVLNDALDQDFRETDLYTAKLK